MFSDQEELDKDIKMLIHLGFRPPKWSYRTNVPIKELTCSKRKFLVDIVCYKEGSPILAIERDGMHHNEEKQQKYDHSKDYLLQKHGIRVWRWWNSNALQARNSIDKVFRRDIKKYFYAKFGTLASDYKDTCQC